MFRMDDADEVVILIDDGQRAEIVLVEEFGHFAGVRVRTTGDQVAVGDFCQRHGGSSEKDADYGDDQRGAAILVDEIDVGDEIKVTLKAGKGLKRIGDSRCDRKSDVVGGHAARG